MRTQSPLRPELASVLRFLAIRRSPGIVYPTSWPPLEGVLAELAAPRGRQ
jgi:hypothetical protein